MIQFNDLRINPEGNELIIDVSVLPFEEYENVYLDNLVIDTQDTYVVTGPSSNPLYTYQFSGNSKSARIKLVPAPTGSSEFALAANFKTTMFFVYVTVRGTATGDAANDPKTTLGTVVDLYSIYQETIQYMKELTKNCIIPKKFIDLILRTKALDLAVKTGNYVAAKNFWIKFFANRYKIVNQCGCDGNNNMCCI